jgi:hypothetical protein
LTELLHNLWVTNAKMAALSIITCEPKWGQFAIAADGGNIPMNANDTSSGGGTAGLSGRPSGKPSPPQFKWTYCS